MSIDGRGRDAGSAVRTTVDGVAVPDPAVVVRRARTSTTLARAVLATIIVLVAAAVAIPLLRDDDRVTVAAPGPGTTGTAQVDDRFVPATTTAHGVTRMPVTLPDGRPFTVSYEPDLRLARRGFRSTVAARLFLGGDFRNVQTRTLSVLRTTAAERYPGLTPVATYPDAAGAPVPYYVDPAAPDRGGLAVQIGAWLVVVPDLDDPANHPDDHLTPEQLAVWAQNVGGWVDDDGFLVVASTGRALMLDQSAKGAFVLGPTSTHSGGVSIGERWLCEGPGTDTTTPRRFPTTPPGANQGAAWCDRATGLHVTVLGPQRFVDRAIASFRIAPFSTAPRATKIALSDRTITAGTSVPGVVVVVNNTGAPLTYGGCGGLFAVARDEAGRDARPGLARVPAAASPCRKARAAIRPTSLAARSSCSTGTICSLPPGEYDAVFAQNGSDFPDCGADSGTRDRRAAGLIRRRVRAPPALRAARGSARASGGGS